MKNVVYLYSGTGGDALDAEITLVNRDLTYLYGEKVRVQVMKIDIDNGKFCFCNTLEHAISRCKNADMVVIGQPSKQHNHIYDGLCSAFRFFFQRKAYDRVKRAMA